ncbi:MAG TPA: PBP1A family penicillin-binding protein [Elusimicrobiota bacterium]|nr:PBP1A family penicillin-binding protein [Elusimicrobiota bacterium]
MPKGRKLPRLVRALALLAALFLAAAAALSFWAERRIAAFQAGAMDAGHATTIYSAPYVVGAGAVAPPERILQRLWLLDYRAAKSLPPPPGGYVWAPPVLTVGLRGFLSPGFRQQPGVFTLTWHASFFHAQAGHWTIADAAGLSLADVGLEPAVIAKLSGGRLIARTTLAPRQVSPALEAALVSAEDRRFYSHGAFDFRGIARAAWEDVRHPGQLQGGSTLTQQLAKNIFLDPRRTWTRKILEAALSLYISERFTKEDILALYLNHVYMGQDGSASMMGAQAAARYYFGKDQGALTLGQCALLAGLVRSPYLYNPYRDPAAALRRRNTVLNQMRAQGRITIFELQAALKEPLGLRPESSPATRGRTNDYFAAEVLRELSARYGDDAVFRQGLAVYTTMDPLLQKAAQDAVAQKARPQGALIALDPETGAVLALSGGRDFGQSQFDRATQAVRQPGSAFKPFLYGAALEAGLTPLTTLNDSPRAFSRGRGRGVWRPKNAENRYYGQVSLRQALALSLNAASLNLAEKVGAENVIAFARKMGLETPLPDNLAVMIGASDTTLEDLTAAYAPFDNGGRRVTPFLITEVRDARQRVLETDAPQRVQVITPALAYVMTSLLESVVREGTASGAKALGWTWPSAGKTGTTNGGADAWFIGYTPQLLAGVWVGADNHRPLWVYGSSAALPVWTDFMEEASKDYAQEDFTQPSSVVTAAVDPKTGLLARWDSPARETEVFLPGTAPTRYDPVRARGLKGWFERIFRR